MTAPGYQISRDPTAVMGARTAAWIVDLLLYVVLIVGVLGPTPLSPLAEYAEVPDNMSMDTACDQVGNFEDDVSGCFLIGDRVYFTDASDAAIQIVGWLLYVGLIYVLWQGLTGLTPGKLLFGLRTVGEDGRAPGPVKAFIRSVLWIVDGFPYCIPGIVGFFVGLTSSGHRRVGDMAAKTFVVGKSDMGQPVMVAGLTTGTYGQPGYGQPQPGYGAQMPGATWGGPPPGAPGAPGAQGWGTPPGAPPMGSYPGTDARPAPPTSPYGTPAAGPAAPGVSGTPSGGYAAPEPTSPTAPAPAPAPESPAAPSVPGPDAGFGESSDPSDADADRPAGGATPSAGEVSGATPDAGDASATTDEGLSSEPSSAEPEPAASPESPAPAEPAAPTQGTAPTAEQTYSPQWDAARGAYIQWDPNRSRWLQWDDTAKEWKPI